MEKVSDDARVERIRIRAHQLWERDGGPHGRHVDYWLAAEREFAETENGEPSPEATEKVAESVRINRKPVKSVAADGNPGEHAPAAPAIPRVRRKARQAPDASGCEDDV